MKSFVFLHPHALVLFGPFFLIVALQIREARRRGEALDSYLGTPEGMEKGFRKVLPRLARDHVGFALGILGLITALGGPAYRTEHDRTSVEGRDVLIVLDVSRSMAAEDLPPNRLQWAKALVRTLSKTSAVDRMGLILFSQKAVIRCPLTWDKSFFHSVLDEIDLPPEPFQGTELISGIKEAVRLLLSAKEPQRPRAVLVLTDGEDHGSDPLPLIQESEQLELSWVFVGLGDSVRGARIPVQDEDGRRRFLRYQGAEVWSRMDPVFLQRLADASPRSVFWEAKGSPEDFARTIHAHLESLGVSSLNYGAAASWREWFQIPLVMGIVFLMLDFCLPNRRLGAL